MIRFSVAQWNNGELGAFFKGLFRNDSLSQLQQQLESQYQRNVLLLNSARAGIKIALRYGATKQPARQLVLYPEYICASVPQAIKEAGFIGKAVAVTAELNMCPQAVAAEMSEPPLAVILPHMYGVAANIVEIAAICRQHQVLLIDDAAQVAGVKLDGKLLGTFGDFGVISFAQAKTIVTGVQGSGGVLLYPAGTTLDIQLKQTAGWCRLWSLWHFWASYQQDGMANRIDYYLQRIWQLLRKNLVRSPVQLYADGYAMAAPDAAVAIRQFATVPERISLLQHQATVATAALEGLHHLEFPQLQAGRYLTRLIIRSITMPPEELAKLCMAHGIKTKRAYGNSNRAFEGCFSSGLLELPWQGLNADELAALTKSLKSVDNQLSNTLSN